ncbi:MAG: acetoacetate--CoA ligase [Chloroflexota bacterium]
MTQIAEGELLWQPSRETVEQAKLTKYMAWLAEQKKLTFSNYRELWQWSVNEISDFWESLWQYFEIVASQQPETILDDEGMPNVQWFKGARLNWAENILSKATDQRPFLLYKAEDDNIIEISWPEMTAKVTALQQALRDMGVQKGDRVVAYLPNIPEAIAGVLAVTSLGAIWSSSSPDFGTRSVLDRFTQIEPKVLLAVDGYTYNGKPFDRIDTVGEIQNALPTLEKTILIPLLNATPDASKLDNIVMWHELMVPDEKRPLQFEQVPFDHPLWVLYSSGTTGLPKPIVHGHGGVLLEHYKSVVFHNDLGPEDRFFWFTSTGWMMWNYLIGALLSGATVLLFNGSPGYPNLNTLWAFAEQTGMTYFGLSPAYVSACMKAQIEPKRDYDLSALRGIGSTGAPLPVTGFEWIYEHVKPTVSLESLSGGTDLCTAFVGGARTEPIFAGELQGASLGAKVESFDADGQPVKNEVGELVISQPMPSMPIYFWNDPDKARYLSSYFEMFPGIWRHGDWIKINDRGGCVIYGRSDSTINRKGIRMGTSEIYQSVESHPEILDSLVIDLEMLGRDSYMPLFVVLRKDSELTDELKDRINKKLRLDASPRHVPNEIFQVEQIPYTLSGKKMEVPIRRILLGHDMSKAINTGAMRNPESIQFFIDLRDTLSEHP